MSISCGVYMDARVVYIALKVGNELRCGWFRSKRWDNNCMHTCEDIPGCSQLSSELWLIVLVDLFQANGMLYS